MSKTSEAVKRWRRATKNRIVEAMGNKCQCCGYNKCQEALELHHLNPEEKEISFGSIRANPISWPKIVEELKKCVLVCSNCHKEIHSKTISVPENIAKFDESYADYKVSKKLNEPITCCPVCGKEKESVRKYCSLKCSGKSHRKIDWDSINLKELYETKSIIEIAEMLDITYPAVKKRLVKVGLLKSNLKSYQ